MAAADIYGKRHCTTIYGMLYSAKGTAALLVPVSAWMVQKSGWSSGLFAAAPLNFGGAALAILVLKPARVKAASGALIPDAMGITRV